MRSHLFEIPQNRFAYLSCKRVILFASLLWTADVKDVPFPVHVVQSQGNDFTPSQPIDRQEQQNGAVPDIMGTVRIGAANESRCTSSHFGPAGSVSWLNRRGPSIPAASLFEHQVCSPA